MDTCNCNRNINKKMIYIYRNYVIHYVPSKVRDSLLLLSSL